MKKSVATKSQVMQSKSILLLFSTKLWVSNRLQLYPHPPCKPSSAHALEDWKSFYRCLGSLNFYQFLILDN